MDVRRGEHQMKEDIVGLIMRNECRLEKKKRVGRYGETNESDEGDDRESDKKWDK